MLNKNHVLNKFEGREVEFVNNVLIPVFQNMTYEVDFHHGPNEHGKDLILRKIDDFDRPRYTAVIAKAGDIGNTTTKSKRNLSEVQIQVQQAWNTPFTNASWRERDKYVSEVIVITSGNITASAESQITGTLDGASRKENTQYFSREKLVSLIDKYFPEMWESELPILSKYLSDFKKYIEEITESNPGNTDSEALISTTCIQKEERVEGPDSPSQPKCEIPTELIKPKSRIWFQGGTGSGKTFIAHNYANRVQNELRENQPKGRLLPVPIYLRAIWFNRNEDVTLEGLIERSLAQLRLDISKADLDAWTSTRGYCIFFDEFELNLDANLLNRIDDQLRQKSPNSSIIILSRLIEESAAKNIYRNEVWHLSEINLSQASKALTGALKGGNAKAKHLYKEIIQGSLLERLPRTPLAINILKKVFVDLQIGKLPNNAFEFLDMYFEITLGRWEQRRDPTQPLDYKQVKSLLQVIAFKMVSQEKVAIPVSDIEDLADQLLETTGQKGITGKEYIYKVASYGEVCRITNGVFEFVQRTYMEFLAGCEIMNQHWNVNFVLDNFLKIGWEDSIIFAAGGKQKDDNILRVISDKQVDSLPGRFAKIKNLGLISQALYHSSVSAKAYAIESGAQEAVRLRDDESLSIIVAKKNAVLAPITSTYMTLHFFAIFYARQALVSALEKLLATNEKTRQPYYYFAAYAALPEDLIDPKVFERAARELPTQPSPEQQAIGGYLKGRGTMLQSSAFHKLISIKPVKRFAKRTKAILADLRRGVIPRG